MLLAQAAQDVADGDEEFLPFVEVQTHDQAGQQHGDDGQSVPDHGDDQPGEDVGVNRDGQGHVEVALVGQEAAIEAAHRQDQHAHRDGDHADREQSDHNGADGLEEPMEIIGAGQQLNGKMGHHGHQQQSREQRQHHPGRGPEFMFHGFAQHLNTSLNSASTDVPFSLRMASTVSWSTIRPFCRNRTSSSTCSTSEMRWVEMMIEAFSL